MSQVTHATDHSGNDRGWAVAILRIDAIIVSDDHRTASRAKVRSLADSIESDGLLQPIVVRRDLVDPNRYLLVFGRHRLEAVQTLKWTSIEAVVLDLDDGRAESAMLAENLFRANLKSADYLRWLKRWHELYTASHPEAVGVAAMAAGPRRHRAARKAADHRLPIVGKQDDGTGLDRSVLDEPAASPRFDVVAAKALNVSTAKIRRDSKTARAFSDAELEELDRREVHQSDLHRLADIKDGSTRKRAVCLVTSGMETDVAIALAHAPEDATVEYVEATDSGIKPEAEMTDDEWLDHCCKDALARLVYRDSFRRDAIIWRKSAGLLSALRRSTRGFLTGYPITPRRRKMLPDLKDRSNERRRSMPRCVSPTRPI